jgi:hypothetical protein
MAQFIGFSNIFGEIISQIPNYLERFSSFALDLFRKVVSNPIGFMGVFVSIFIANYSIDSLFNTIVNDLDNAVNYVSSSISNFISTITLQSCGAGDIACYVYNAFAEFSKYLLQGVYIAFIYPITYVIGAFLQFISYVIRTNMYLVQSTLCYVANTWFPPISGTYVAFKSFQHISSWIFHSALSAIHSGKAGRGILGIIAGLATPILSFISVDALAQGLLVMVENVFGINCANIKPPSLNITVQAPQLGTISQNTVESTTYSLMYKTTQSALNESIISGVYGLSGSLATYDLFISAESTIYSLSYSLATQFLYQSGINSSYALRYAKAPYTQLSDSVNGRYALTPSVSPPIQLSSKESTVYGLSFGSAIKLKLSISEFISYSLETITAIGLFSNISSKYSLTVSATGKTMPPQSSVENASYSLSGSVTAVGGSGVSASGTTLTFTYTMTLEGFQTGSSAITLQYNNVSDSYQS